MNILENNRDVLYRLYNEYPESLNELRIEGNYLVYRDLKTDISEFNIERLVNENSSFAASISVLSSEDIFKIVRFHSEMITSTLEMDSKNNASNKERMEVIKQENPLMRNINVISRIKDGYTEEFVVIVDSMGVSNVFKNDYNVNIFDIYESLKYSHVDRDVTPDELVDAINRRLHRIRLDGVDQFSDKDTVTEDFENKMDKVNNPYKDDKMYRVLGNQENDIAVVQDLHDGTNNSLVTFDNNEFGDLMVESHNQNTNGDASTYQGDNSENSTISLEDDIKKDVVARLITTREFYDFLDSDSELTPEQRNNVDLYYAYLGDLIMYEDYLLDELKAILNSFRAYVDGLENMEPESLNGKQKEAIDKNVELTLKKDGNNNLEYSQVENKVKKLVLQNPDVYENAGSVGVIQVIAFIIGITIILTAVTLYLLG